MRGAGNDELDREGMVTARRGRLVLILGLVTSTLIVVPPQPAQAHKPTQGLAEYSANAAESFQFGSPTPPTWLTSAVRTAAEALWVDAKPSRTPNFNENGTGAAVRYIRPSDNPYVNDECPDTFYFACTDYLRTSSGERTTWRYTVLNSQQDVGGDRPGHDHWYWCEDPNQPTLDCIDVYRTTLHELGHAVGLGRRLDNGHDHQPDYPTTTAAETLMQLYPLRAADFGYDRRRLGVCDIFELLREYDTNDYAAAIPACTDHLTDADTFAGGKIKTTAYQSAASVAVCYISGYELTGTLRLVNQSGGSQLGRLAGNALAGRTVEIYHRSPSGSYPSTPQYTAVVEGGSGASWSVAVRASGTRVFKALFDPGGADAVTLNSDASAERSVAFTSC